MKTLNFQPPKDKSFWTRIPFFTLITITTYFIPKLYENHPRDPHFIPQKGVKISAFHRIRQTLKVVLISTRAYNTSVGIYDSLLHRGTRRRIFVWNVGQMWPAVNKCLFWRALYGAIFRNCSVNIFHCEFG